MKTYIPFRQVFYICKFHDSELVNEDNTLQCHHPSIIETTGSPGTCSSNCIARKILETIAMQWDGNSLSDMEIEKIENL